MWAEVEFWLFTGAVAVQGFFIVFVFSRLAFYRLPSTPNPIQPAVSVLVAAHNEFENLRVLLPLLQNQDYPAFEVIVLDDRSSDGTSVFAKQECATYNKIRFVQIKETHAHITPKKYALTVGIKHASHDIILLTDADCRPNSNRWIAEMAAQLTEDKDIVVGFSPYKSQPGFLNGVIQYETFYTALQYFSLALAGNPYMGVGRNLMYRKSVFLKNRGFYSHINVVGGDDDLLLNEIATASNTAVCLHPDAFVTSEPKENWRAWLTQKRRHLSVGKYYKTRNKIILGLLNASHALVWALGVGLLCAAQNDTIWVWTAGFLGGRLVVFGLIYALANHKLSNKAAWYALPFFDFVMIFYFAFMAIFGFVNRKNKVSWK